MEAPFATTDFPDLYAWIGQLDKLHDVTTKVVKSNGRSPEFIGKLQKWASDYW